jgi:transketolase
MDSKCPGHPEYRLTSGVETTTGPLGQGVATSVGMAIASRWMAAHFNRPGFEMLNYDVYALCGDGDMMEGVSSEAASLAGHLKLSNLCWIYDSNRITIEGHTDLAFSEDTAARFMAYGWNVTRVSDATDLEGLVQAFSAFKTTADRPTFIVLVTCLRIAEQQDIARRMAAARRRRGAPDERAYGWPEDEKFLVPTVCGILCRGRRCSGREFALHGSSCSSVITSRIPSWLRPGP